MKSGKGCYIQFIQSRQSITKTTQSNQTRMLFNAKVKVIRFAKNSARGSPVLLLSEFPEWFPCQCIKILITVSTLHKPKESYYSQSIQLSISTH